MCHYLGIDVGSTTVKAYLTDEDDKCLYSNYVRHNSDVRNTILTLLEDISEKYSDIAIYPVITGSGGLSISESLNRQSLNLFILNLLYRIFNVTIVITANAIPTIQNRVTIFGSGIPFFWKW